MLEITLFGAFEARCDGQSLEGLQERRANRLLALLILERNRSVQRQWIEFVLDMPYTALRKAESILRACLGEEKTRVKVEKNSLFLDVRGVQVDVFEFESLIARHDLNSLQKAVHLYHGGLLKDWEGVWLQENREELQESYLDALQTLTKTAVQAQEYDKAATYLRRFTHAFPEMDSAWAQLIEVHRMAGNRSLAEQAYADYLASLARRSEEEACEVAPSARVIALVHSLRSPATAAAPVVPPVRAPSPAITHFEPVGGAVPLDSPYYIQRSADHESAIALTPQTSFLLIKGARQTGKTSLLARLLQQGRQKLARIVRTDWQNIPQADLESAETFLLNLTETLSEQLRLDLNPRDCFDPLRPPTRNFERFLRRNVFPAVDDWLVWGIDEADRLFDCPFRDDIFGMLRSWHNERALDPETEWRRLTIVLSYATEAYLIGNLNQSPFNIGFPVTLADFNPEQVQELNQRYGTPLQDEGELQRLYALVGGHPYLVRLSLQEMALRRLGIAGVESQAETDTGLFRDHLMRMRLALLRDEDLTATVRAWLQSAACPPPEHFARLCAAGIMTGASPSEMRPRCQLYDLFLRRVLL